MKRTWRAHRREIRNAFSFAAAHNGVGEGRWASKRGPTLEWMSFLRRWDTGQIIPDMARRGAKARTAGGGVGQRRAG
ncbi:hypothetical protein HPP92_016524 [Vanilla planifolia]|uniref:Uncharacterized protein n=1 Tax=Vanilla planifolia TaxID=51239 RepID=A0A835UNJ1_VANPL|nr:hypothetical protein HPP92_016524 [Vanilla planifolia]